MIDKAAIRLTAALALSVSGGMCHGQFSQPISRRPPSASVPSAGQNTPPSAPSSTPAPAATAGSAVAAAPSPQKPARKADVSFVGGQLMVKADNSSLNLILREIGRQTGIKITGGVAEERVFGNYGPATPAEVLNRLLDGTSSNMLLIANEGAAPGELVLTPRQGGPTPPNPNAKGFDDDSDDDSDAAQTPRPKSVTLFGGAQQTETPPPANSATAPPVTPAAGVDATGATPTTNPQSPNGIKTPQEIYQQLQQLRQQQQQQPGAAPPQ